MGFAEILAIALALAMDALAVAVATGFKQHCNLAQTLRMAGTFGLFQFLMPIIGWGLGLSVRAHIEAYDHWVAFGLLLCVGGKMLYEGLRGGEENCSDNTRGLTLLLLALATSIDALAVGISLALLKLDIWRPAVVIGLVCFALTAAGMHLGRALTRQGSLVPARANIFGGLVLIGIGVKILFEHGVFQGSC